MAFHALFCRQYHCWWFRWCTSLLSYRSPCNTDHSLQLLAFAIAKMDGIGGYGGWRWIFIIEGLMTTVIGVFAKFWVSRFTV